MLNKKAIAALAAGATLVSGLAFAAPAMAFECPANPPLKSAAKTDADAAYTAYDEANTVLGNMTVSEDAAEPTVTYPAGKTKADYYTINNTTKLVELKDAVSDLPEKDAKKVREFAEKRNAHVNSSNAYNAQQRKVSDLQTKYLEKKYVLDHCATPDPDKNQEMIDKVYASKHNLDNKEAILNKKQKAFDDALKSLKSTTAKVEALTAVRDAAKAALDKFDASGVKDSATRTRLQDALDRAQAHLDRVAGALVDAKKAYDDALKDVKKAVADYNEALQAYKDVYNEAVKMGIDPSALPAIVTSDPLDPKFPTVPGARDLYAKALSGEFGKAVQAAAKKGQKEAKKGEAKKEAGKKGASAAAPAGAKLDTKAAAAASAAPLSKTGVTVMFTALAASMLAGIGAAVRKFRH